MNKIWLILISLSLATFSFFSVQAEEGELLAQEHCSSCHENTDLYLISLSDMSHLTKNEMIEVMLTGKMKTQAKNLTNSEKEKIASFLTEGEANQDQVEAFLCNKNLETEDLQGNSLWTSWGHNSFNTRHQRFSDINSKNVANLKLKWSFGLRTNNPRAQPIAVGSVIFISGGDTTYALDKETGCAYWIFTSAARLRNAPAFDTNTKDSIYLIDQDFGTYKLNALNGQLIWKVNIPKETEWSTSSASPVVVGEKLVVPLSTIETIAPLDPKHECCKSSGGMALLETKTGNIVWNHRVLEEAKYVGKVFVTRTKKYAPAGAAVWNAPGVDPENKTVFFGTGQSTQSPASEFSDAIITLDLKTGEKIWSTQTLSGDAHNVACEVPVLKRLSCPDEDGPDFDFGASVIQSKSSDGESVLLAGQKSGWVFGLNNKTGAIKWKTRVGRGGTLGGIHFGMAIDDDKLFVPVSDREVGRTYDWEKRPGLYALDIDTGGLVWSYALDDICGDREAVSGKGRCFSGFSAPVSVAGDVLFAGSLDGRFSAHSTKNGSKLWEFDTLKSFNTVNNYPASGGSIDGAGPVIVDDWVFINSGYSTHGQMTGNVLLAFSVEQD
jgi:polyvinyl alcohol dehydrogenase (cytochrome)